MQEIHKIEDLPPTFEQIVNAVEELREDSIKMLQELVEIESKLGNESAVQNYMENLFVNMKLKTHRWTIIKDDIKDLPGFSPVNWKYDNKECVVGTHFPKFGEKGKSLILNGHLDVVPEGPKEMWTEDPFKSYVKDGRVYGRGSGDMKAGVVCFVMAFKALQKLGYNPGSRIHLQSVIEEECSGNGTLSCCQKGYGADACIIPEPFGDTIVTAQPGVMWLNVEVNGKPVHVLDTSAGVNAIHAAYAIYQDLQKLEEEWNEPKNRHPSYPVESFKHPINFNLGLINGGDWASTVPTKCEFGIRIGFFPGRKLTEVREEIENRISESAKRIGVTHKLTWNGFQAEGCVMDPNGDMMKLLGKNFEKVTKNPPSFKPITATTDARFFQLYYGIPATCLGPEATNIHGIDESVSIESMMDTTKTLATFISEWCGLEKIPVFRN